MKFQKGHKINVGSHRGRPPGKATQYKRWLEQNEHKIAELLNKLYEMGTNGDREAAIYVINRFAGTPKQTVDSRSINVSFTPDDYIRLLPMIEGLQPANYPQKVQLTEREEDV